MIEYDIEDIELSRFCDEYCFMPYSCRTQEQLDCECDNCPFNKLLLLLLDTGIAKEV